VCSPFVPAKLLTFCGRSGRRWGWIGYYEIGQKNQTPCRAPVPNVPEAVAFYKSVFPNAKVETVNDFMATFELEGQKFNALNGGPKYKFNEAISFFISVESQEEVDYFWNRLIADGGEESKCGWLKDKFGLSWQVVPTALGRYLSDPDRKKADRAMQAMMKMQKIVIAELDKAYAG
jgi:predicted 3-demethylubiquinone-9 3-methyltransferase (glyoxalase superfamily)